MDTRHNKGTKFAEKWNDWHHVWESDPGGRPLDRLRDNLCSHFQRIAGFAQPVPLSESTVDCVQCLDVCVTDIGLIELSQGPVRWAYATLDGNELLWGELDYGIPDQKQLPAVRIRATGVRSFPAFGKVVDVRWDPVKGSLEEDGRVAASLTANKEITRSILATGSLDDDIIVRTCAEHDIWWIGTIWADPEEPPSAEKWACYEAIARHLLALPLG